MSLARNIDFLRHLPKVSRLTYVNGLGRSGWGVKPPVPSRLSEALDFGPNPGNLRMFSFVPDDLPVRSGLVVVLHGCTQTAAEYDIGAGWSTLADRYGFAVLMPEQRPSNNNNTCFNWFNPDDVARGHGEAVSIREMIDRMLIDHDIDRDRVFITGLSAGGAMTSAMLAAYPDVFAAGAVIAGLPYGVASNVKEALQGMFEAPARSPDELGDLVRAATRYRGPWPRISVWHGSADRTVNPANACEIVKQWLDVHGLPQKPMAESVVDGHPHQVWWNADGETVVESYSITDMAHGTPIGLSETDERFGSEGAYLIEAGISSSYLIAKFFGLTRRARRTSEPEALAAVAEPSRRHVTPLPPAELTVRSAPSGRDHPTPPTPSDRRGRRDLSTIILRLLSATGFRKS